MQFHEQGWVWKQGALLGPRWLPTRFQNKISSGLTWESLVTTWELAALKWLTRVAIVVITLGLAFLAYSHLSPAFAQARPQQGFSGGYGDLNSLAAGFRFILRIVVIAIPLILMAYYTWKMRPKDLYEVAWTALGWCGIAYILGMGL